MRTRWILLVAFLALAGTGSALAQPASDSISVSANNAGIFTFDISAASFDFGDVDADGTTSSTGVTGARNGANDGAVYTATGAATFSCNSAPVRTVRIYNASTTSTINWGTANRLSVRIPTTGLPGGSTSCGFVTFGTTGDGGAGACASGNLVHTVSTGNGTNAANGNLDLQLSVQDTDATGANSWTVVLTATGA